MKRLIALILALALVFALAACGSKNEPAPTEAPTEEPSTQEPAAEEPSAEEPSAEEPAAEEQGDPAAAGTTFGIEPFPSSTKLRIAYCAGSPSSSMWWFAEELGFFDELNVDAEILSFSTGPAMMEARADWDVGIVGVPGVINGQVNYGVHCLGITDKEYWQALFVREDSPIYQAGKGWSSDYPDIYGTPETWKGSTWIVSQGTNMEILLLRTLEIFGLTEEDVNIINMDIPTGYTAFKAGEGDGVGTWNEYAVEAAEKFCMIVDGDSISQKVAFPTLMFATDEALTERRDVCKVAYEVLYRTAEWVKDHKQEAAQLYFDLCETEGVSTTMDVANAMYSHFNCPSLKESFENFKTTQPYDGSDRDINNVEAAVMAYMDFYLFKGSYTEADRDKILNDVLCDPTIAQEVEADALASGRLG